MGNIQFRIAAKTDVGLERTNNEDNFQASANLDESMTWVNNQEYSLGRKGALLVVADGMGGMNAGEVASEIAIDTVRECFSPDKITDEIVKSRFTIEKYMKGVILEADKRIKDFAKKNPESRSMGTTIVIAWLFDGNLYVSWCGDSRAYIFNPNTGLFQITKDHSYVQDLVDAGKISKEDAFDFPDSNIITRSLSDSTTKANPDCLLMPQKLCNNDIILLCSDGLNGMIRDEEIENIIIKNQSNMTECVDELIKAALDASGADNCTVALCQILSGGDLSSIDRIPKYSILHKTLGDSEEPKRKKWFWLICMLLLLIAGFGGGLWYYNSHNSNLNTDNIIINDTTTIGRNKQDSIEKVHQDSITRAQLDSLNKVKNDSIDKAHKDSIYRKRLQEMDKLSRERGKRLNPDNKSNPKESSINITEIKSDSV